MGRNASENPTGIETNLMMCILLFPDHVATHQKTQQGLKRWGATRFRLYFRRNASENPTGIETNPGMVYHIL